MLAMELENVASGNIDVGGTEKVFAMEISRDGRWLCLGTTHGARAYDWEAVSAASGYLSNPTFQFNTNENRIGSTNNGYVYAVTIDDRRQSLLIGGMTGTLDSLDLRTGQLRMILDIPGRPTIRSMCLSRGGNALACCVMPGFLTDHRNQKPMELQIWNLEQLMRR